MKFFAVGFGSVILTILAGWFSLIAMGDPADPSIQVLNDTDETIRILPLSYGDTQSVPPRTCRVIYVSTRTSRVHRLQITRGRQHVEVQFDRERLMEMDDSRISIVVANSARGLEASFRSNAWILGRGLLGLQTARLEATSNTDIRVGMNPLGLVLAVSGQGILTIERTNNGVAGGTCKVGLFGAVLPKDKGYQAKAIAYLKKRLLNQEIRFLIMSKEKDVFVSSITATDLREGSAVNGYLVYIGLATTDHPEMHEFKYALDYAKKHKLGIWSKKDR